MGVPGFPGYPGPPGDKVNFFFISHVLMYDRDD